MTIKPLDPLHQVPAQARTAAARPAADAPNFAQVLAEQEAAASVKPAAAAAPAAILKNQALSGLIMQGAETAGLEARRQLTQTLDRMDIYATALGDEARTLKDIAPLADDLGQAADRLSRLSHKLKESDPLKELSNEAAVLATVEAMKFKRGDYV